MTTNPEVSKATENSPEVQQVLESTKAGTDALKDEISTISSTKTELNGLGKFFSKLGDAWKELKEGNISKAIAILFGTDQQESQQTSSTSSSESSESSTTTTTGNKSTTTSTRTSTTGTDSKETTNTPTKSKEKEPAGLVSIEKYIPGIQHDLKYATNDNIAKTKIYKDSKETYLRLQLQTVKKLKKAEEIAEKQGYKLKILDAYRPDSAQVTLRNSYKGNKSGKIARPQAYGGKGSNHYWGNAIDVTLTDKNGNDLEMPTEFDSFKGCKYDDIKSGNTKGKQNALKLRKIMEEAQFKPLDSEWWHFDNKK